MKIDSKKIKQLRDRTGVSIMKCKDALKKAQGDMEKAVLELRKTGESSAAKKSQRQTQEGAIASYIHNNNKVGSMVALYCETDFVAKNQEFINLARDIAMQVAASDPRFLEPDKIPQKVIDQEKEIQKETLKKDQKPEEIKEKIVQGKLEKFKKENSLLTQQFIKDPNITIEELINQHIAKLGENIKIGEFSRFAI
ncbi:MAG: elongation factor Ts [Candidatus Moranbacteria bacterium]|nr:elongation factor Ts [Candidatus Moranbacteria bacterium]